MFLQALPVQSLIAVSAKFLKELSGTCSCNAPPLPPTPHAHSQPHTHILTRAFREMAGAAIYLFAAGSATYDHWRKIVADVEEKTIFVFDDLWRTSNDCTPASLQVLLQKFHR